jgi:2-hydroxychromene-2-carboxylate isomerase
LRLCIALGSTPGNIHDIFNFLWGECPPVHQAEAIQGLAKRLGVTHLDQLLSDPKVKTELISNTESAIEDGVYGVPTFVVDEQRFWGLDQMDMMLDFLERGMLIDSLEKERLAHLPTGLRNLHSR